ncbi:hypothetical protein SAMN05444365_104251 [Micromonospora pattaloongensis]|uniref:Uncharacterized protein n=1 Tax=Micromonospora pattaloongensis TaxID=405436 RepID=A0A1H3NZW9_9ACTN|nr:hypothetical protein [Micromonospora pattaloongensis]SDY94358.1 hypothetical protein SAMN05444365_104251 [Micromonospora pattaloongensis]
MRALRAVLALVAALALLLLPASPATAHEGIKLDVAGDGATGVSARATYRDGHPVEDVVLRLVLTATGDDGRSVGPIQLNPASEGRGFYSSGPVLTPGRWQVTVTAPAPNAARAAVTVEARAAQSAPPVTPAAAADAGSTGGWLWWVVAAAAVVALAGTGVALARRR